MHGPGDPEGAATAIARIDEARRNEDLVLAENALNGVRFVFATRIVLVGWLGLTAQLGAWLAGQPLERDWLRTPIILAYILFSVAALLSTRRSKPADLRRAKLMPFLSIAADFAFAALMNWRDAANGQFSDSKLAAVCALYLSFSICYFSLWHVVGSGVAAIGVFVFGVVASEGQLAGRTSLMVPGALAGLAVLIGWANWRTRRMFVNLRKRDNLTRFLPRPVAERIMAQGDVPLRPVQREVTVLFTDIRDFTTFSERMAPAALLAFLDEYLGHMSQIVKGHDGVVNKFLGDGMLAFWGVPDEDPRHAEQALAAALHMRAKLRELNAQREQAGLAPIQIGIGVHTGVVAAGMLGGADQHEYTIIGDAVNVASRVEGLTRRLDTDILVTESTWKLGSAGLSGRRLAEEPVKGRSEPVVVYALDG